MEKVDKFADSANWSTYIGKQVIKHSKKPFKNGSAVNTVKEFTTNPYSGKKAFEMVEGSVVDCFRVKLY